MATHTGTHMDAPNHFGGKDKWSIADIPLENLIEPARWLVGKEIVGVGIDGPSIDCGQCNDYMSHVILNENNIYILENLDQSIFDINPVGATLTVLPMRLSDSSGCPVRPIAQFSHDHHSMNDGHIIKSSSSIIMMIILIISTLFL
ncbi:kynurenine formamidase-like [Dermatophagoides farinae]|uniref:kynurenine formamidase-like n=1 Tax=Dermatophagoides farinae TaxID=6954 RepID=UPI003F5F5398